jgi:hypothetical protein
MSQALATPVEWLAHVFALGTYGCERAPTRLTMITESTAVRTAKVVNEKEAMDDLLTADEFADRPREGSRHNAHVYGRLRRRLRALALSDDLSPSQAAVLTRLHKEGPSSTSALASARSIERGRKQRAVNDQPARAIGWRPRIGCATELLTELRAAPPRLAARKTARCACRFGVVAVAGRWDEQQVVARWRARRSRCPATTIAGPSDAVDALRDNVKHRPLSKMTTGPAPVGLTLVARRSPVPADFPFETDCS